VAARCFAAGATGVSPVAPAAEDANTGLTGAPERSARTGEGARPHTPSRTLFLRDKASLTVSPKITP